jgi:hypothetical protein
MWVDTVGWTMWLLMVLGTAVLWVLVFLLVRELLAGPTHRHDAPRT